MNDAEHLGSIAVIGMSGRFPGARDVETFWRNLRDGIESVRFLSPTQINRRDAHLAGRSDYVPASPMVDDVEWFDATFFGILPSEARFMDPQHRLFLECCWEALEDAGYYAKQCRNRIGLFASCSMSGYLLFHLARHRALVDPFSEFETKILHGNDKDHLTTRVSYKLDLRGPSIAVQTSCSASLVAVCLACESLLHFQSDVALAGGVSLRIPQDTGYIYREGGILSPDGHCRAFDARAAGTVFGSGAGVVVLKRLADALSDGDTVRAVIRGSAINNDGSVKVGYTAPSIKGQADVIAEALAAAGVEAETIGYIEAHGTGTALGDPIEITALAQAFRSAPRKNSCAIGSVKTNIGHLNGASGIAGLIKTVLALEHAEIPPTLHFEQPNRQIDFTNSPFYVNTTLQAWPAGAAPRRAGVSSFGIGGTNAHVVVEQAPPRGSLTRSLSLQLLVISARTGHALGAATDRLIAHLRNHPDQDLADIAYTLQIGRCPFPHRRIAVCHSISDAIDTLERRAPNQMAIAQPPSKAEVAFLFPGQGGQYVNMGFELYLNERVFRAQIDICAQIVQAELGWDLRDVLYPNERAATASPQINDGAVAPLCVFACEYAVAQLWMHWGIYPRALIGHSIGEYAAACVAGVFELSDALVMLTERGRLIDLLPAGGMLAIPLPAGRTSAFLGGGLSLAASNGPANSVVAGPLEALVHLEARLADEGVACRRVLASHAFHSAMMDPILDRFAAAVRRVTLRPPRIPLVSNVTGTWIRAEEAMDPAYWTMHLRRTVRFHDGIGTLLSMSPTVLLEVGPGRILGKLAKQHPAISCAKMVVGSLPEREQANANLSSMLEALGRLWLAGVYIDWPRFRDCEQRRRVPLPTYPFERQRYWVDTSLTDEPDDAANTLTLDPEHARPELANEHVAPRSELERILAAWWQELFGIQPVGIEDDFFALGGDSLLATQLLFRTKEHFQVELPLRRLFGSPTIATMAHAIEELLLERLEGMSDEEIERLT